METITGPELAELLSVTLNNLFYWECAALLEPIEAPGPTTYTIQAVDAFLATREHTFASPLTVAALQSKGKVVTRGVAAITLGINTSTIHYRAKAGTANFVILPLSSAKSEKRFGVFTPVKNDRGPTARLQQATELLDPQTPVTDTTLAVLFGISLHAITDWKQSGLLGDPGAIFTSACARVLLAECLPPLTTVDQWIELRLANPQQKLYTRRGAARHLGIDPITLLHFLQTRQAGYIKLPSGGAWHLTSEVLEAYKAKR
ncbi:MAG TPA: hypothetical protein VLG40_04170 [Candidatus Saccharimonas sp.]|nr:hypothetical protein [Candidatus Saccharimonas sp.]